MLKIGMLTSGGDCQGLNAALRGVAKTLYNELGDKVTIYGIRDGYRGLIEGDYHEMLPEDFSDILTVGGTILGTSRQPFKEMRKTIEDSEETKLDKMLHTVKKAGFDCLVILGGNGTHKTANLLSMKGVNVVTLPKTIDNDLWGTELTLYAGIASGADVIVIPEIPYSAKKIAAAIEKRAKAGKRFSIIAVAEGAISQDEAKLSKKEFKAAREAMTYPSISYRIADELKELTGQEIRVTIPGHYQRGGAPCPADRVLTSRFGVAAAQLILQKKFGYMVALQDNHIVPVPLTEVAGKLKTVPPDGELVKQARALGLSMGD